MSTTPNSFLTFTGRKFDLLNPAPGDVDIRDIAHALSHVNRFGGHTPKPYSVGEHSIFVMEIAGLLFDQSKNTDTRSRAATMLYALMHDAAEAYVGDVISPLKSLLKDYKAIEARVQAAILTHVARNFEWEAAPEFKLGPWANRADCLAFVFEWTNVKGNKIEDLQGGKTGIPDEDFVWVVEYLKEYKLGGHTLQDVEDCFLWAYERLVATLQEST